MKCEFLLDGTGGETCKHCGQSADKPIDQTCTLSKPAEAPRKSVRLKGPKAVKAWRAVQSNFDKSSKPCGGCGKKMTPEQAKRYRARARKSAVRMRRKNS